jgi:mRNA interferase HigB
LRVISKKALRVFWSAPKRPKEVQPLFVGWHKVVLAADWHNFAELRQTFNSADQLGDCIVFNVGGNKYRIVGRVRYAKIPIPGVVYILRVMTHAEYDENTWPEKCGCFEPPPRARRHPGKT